MALTVSPQVACALRAMARERPLELRINGGCMAPLLASGARVRVCARRLYWPGDVLVIHAADGRLLAHRLLGWCWRQGELRGLTQADAACRPDPALSPSRILGKVSGGCAHPHAVRVPLQHRAWALGRLLRHALRGLRRGI